MSKKILILGANSTGGAYAAYYFASLGYEVIATSRSQQAHKSQLPYLFYECPRVHYKVHSLNSSIADHLQLFEESKPSCIINFASQSMVGQSWISPTDWMQTNCVGQTSLLEALRQYKELDLYFHFSTPEVYGSTTGWVDETCIYNPTTPYASSRMLGDVNTKIWSHHYSIPTVLTRAANIYSEGQHLYRIIPRTMLAASGIDPLVIDGNGESIRSFIHMSDVCDFLYAVIQSPPPSIYTEYHLSPRESTSIIDLVKKIFSMFAVPVDSPSYIRFGPDRPGKDMYYLLDSSKANNDYSWSPKISLDQGLDLVQKWFLSADLSSFPRSYSHKA